MDRATSEPPYSAMEPKEKVSFVPRSFVGGEMKH